MFRQPDTYIGQTKQDGGKPGARHIPQTDNLEERGEEDGQLTLEHMAGNVRRKQLYSAKLRWRVKVQSIIFD